MPDELKLGVKIEGLEDGLAALQKLRDALAGLNSQISGAPQASTSYGQPINQSPMSASSRAYDPSTQQTDAQGLVTDFLAASGINNVTSGIQTGGASIDALEAAHRSQMALSPGGMNQSAPSIAQGGGIMGGGPIQVSIISSVPLSFDAGSGGGASGGSPSSSGGAYPGGGGSSVASMQHQARHQESESEGWVPAVSTRTDRFIHRTASRLGLNHLSANQYNRMADPSIEDAEPDEYMKPGYRMEFGEEFLKGLPNKGIGASLGRMASRTEAFKSVSEGLAFMTGISPGIGRAIDGLFGKHEPPPHSASTAMASEGGPAGSLSGSPLGAMAGEAGGAGSVAAGIGEAAVGAEALKLSTGAGGALRGIAGFAAANVIPLSLAFGGVEAIRAGLEMTNTATAPRFQTDTSIVAQQAAGNWINPYSVDAQRRAADVRGEMAVGGALFKNPVANLLGVSSIYELTAGRDLEKRERLEDARGEMNEKLQDISIMTGGKREDDALVARGAELQGISAYGMFSNAGTAYWRSKSLWQFLDPTQGALRKDIADNDTAQAEHSSLVGAEQAATSALGGFAFGKQDAIKGLVTQNLLKNYENPQEAAQGLGLIAQTMQGRGFGAHAADLLSERANTSEGLKSILQADAPLTAASMASTGNIDGLTKLRETMVALAQTGETSAEALEKTRQSVEDSFKGFIDGAARMKEVSDSIDLAGTQGQTNSISAQMIAARGGSAASVAGQISQGAAFFRTQQAGAQQHLDFDIANHANLNVIAQDRLAVAGYALQAQQVPRQAYEVRMQAQGEEAQAAMETASVGVARSRYGMGGISGIASAYTGEVSAAQQQYEFATAQLRTPNLQPQQIKSLRAAQASALYNLQVAIPAQAASEEYALGSAQLGAGSASAQFGLASSMLAGGTQAGVDAAYGGVVGNLQEQRSQAQAQAVDTRLSQVDRANAAARLTQLDQQIQITMPQQEAATRYGRVGAQIGVQSSQAGAASIMAGLYGGPEQQRAAALQGAGVFSSELANVNTQIANAGSDKISYEAYQALLAKQTDLMARLAQATEQAERGFLAMNVQVAGLNLNIGRSSLANSEQYAGLGGAGAISATVGLMPLAQSGLSAAQDQLNYYKSEVASGRMSANSQVYLDAQQAVVTATGTRDATALAPISAPHSISTRIGEQQASNTMAALSSNFATFGDVRGVATSQIQMAGRDLREDQAGLSAALRNIDQLNIPESEKSGRRQQAQLEYSQRIGQDQSLALSAQNTLQNGWMDRLISQTFNAPSRGAFVDTQFTHAEAAAYTEAMSPAFGFSGAGGMAARNRFMAQGYRLANGDFGMLNTQEGFIDTALASGRSGVVGGHAGLAGAGGSGIPFGLTSAMPSRGMTSGGILAPGGHTGEPPPQRIEVVVVIKNEAGVQVAGHKTNVTILHTRQNNDLIQGRPQPPSGH